MDHLPIPPHPSCSARIADHAVRAQPLRLFTLPVSRPPSPLPELFFFVPRKSTLYCASSRHHAVPLSSFFFPPAFRPVFRLPSPVLLGGIELDLKYIFRVLERTGYRRARPASHLDPGTWILEPHTPHLAPVMIQARAFEFQKLAGRVYGIQPLDGIGTGVRMKVTEEHRRQNMSERSSGFHSMTRNGSGDRLVKHSGKRKQNAGKA